MKWHWFRKHQQHPCQIVFVPVGLDEELPGEVWCNTHEFYLSSDSDIALIAAGVAHVAQYGGTPGPVLTY